jgi:hypothetical protein
MQLVIEYCEAERVGEQVRSTVILEDGELEHLTHLATYVPAREINWEQSFARKGLDYQHYQLDGGAVNDFWFKRKSDAPKNLPFMVRMKGDLHCNGYTHQALQGDLLTFVRHAPVLSYHKLNRRKFVTVNECRFKAPANGKTILGDIEVAKTLLHGLSKTAQADFEREVLNVWDSSKSFLNVRVI